jgi:hypothetical protein
LVVGRHFFGCAPERLPLWPGLSQPSTQRRLKDEADIAAICGIGGEPAAAKEGVMAGLIIPTTDSQRYESHAIIAWQKPKRVLHISVGRIGWVSAGQWQKG